jgi:hypothetical protein
MYAFLALFLCCVVGAQVAPIGPDEVIIFEDTFEDFNFSVCAFPLPNKSSLLFHLTPVKPPRPPKKGSTS